MELDTVGNEGQCGLRNPRTNVMENGLGLSSWRPMPRKIFPKRNFFLFKSCRTAGLIDSVDGQTDARCNMQTTKNIPSKSKIGRL